MGVERLRSALCTIGVVLTGTGVLILGFVAYQLWGTGIYTARQQGALKARFEVQTADPEVGTDTPAAPPPVSPPPPPGEAVAIIRIPRIALDEAVVEGVSLADLRKGPGHYPSTPLPGPEGNAAIAGHRTTYGAPFGRLDELSPGDEILVTTLKGTYTYRVEEQKIVHPSEVDVLDPAAEPRLTLTTCHPKFSAARRLVVVAGLASAEAPVSAPVPAPTKTATPSSVPSRPGQPPTGVDPAGGSAQVSPPRPAGRTGRDAQGAESPAQLADAGLASVRSKVLTVLWGSITALFGAAWWWAVRRRRHWTTFVGGAVPFLVVLFFFYANLEQLLPANF